MQEDYDVRTIPLLLRDIDVMEQIKTLSRKLELAEAFNFAYVGSKWDKQQKNQKAFANWQSRIQNEIRKLLGQKIPTIWDNFKKGKSKKL